MYELQLYTARAYGMVASLLCIHDLLMTTNLDVEKIKETMEMENVDQFIDYKRDILNSIPKTLANLESFSKVDVEKQMANPKVGTDVVVLLALIYIHFKDTLVQINLCLDVWERYANIHESFKGPYANIARVFGAIRTLLLPLFKKVEPLAIGVHSSVQETKPEFVKRLYTGVMQHNARILCEYSTKCLTLL